MVDFGGLAKVDGHNWQRQDSSVWERSKRSISRY
jgi:hypothetical protein